MSDIKCPIEPCIQRFDFTKIENARKDLQHHLYMHHGIGVIQSHEMTRHAIAQFQVDKDISKHG
jgi:hypothetical protein